MPGVAPSGRAALVRRDLHGQHADGVPQPPFGYSLFYLKSVAPPQISMATIFRSAVPFMALQWLGALASASVFPQIILWLPSLLYSH